MKIHPVLHLSAKKTFRASCSSFSLALSDRARVPKRFTAAAPGAVARKIKRFKYATVNTDMATKAAVVYLCLEPPNQGRAPHT